MSQAQAAFLIDMSLVLHHVPHHHRCVFVYVCLTEMLCIRDKNM